MMKTFLTLLFAAIFSIAGLNAQTSSTPESFLTGKWSVFVKGTPQGDVTLPVRFEMKEGKLKGFYTDLESKEEKAMDTAYFENDKYIMGFLISGYDLKFVMTKKTDDSMTGSLMDMFEVEATRVKEENETK
jgi:cytochrome c